jgi:hypothetical protein
MTIPLDLIKGGIFMRSSGSSYNIPSTKMGMPISQQPTIAPGALVDVRLLFSHNTNVYLAERINNVYYFETGLASRPPIAKVVPEMELEDAIVIHQLEGNAWTIILHKAAFYAVQTSNLVIKAEI